MNKIMLLPILTSFAVCGILIITDIMSNKYLAMATGCITLIAADIAAIFSVDSLVIIAILSIVFVCLVLIEIKLVRRAFRPDENVQCIGILSPEPKYSRIRSFIDRFLS